MIRFSLLLFSFSLFNTFSLVHGQTTLDLDDLMSPEKAGKHEWITTYQTGVDLYQFLHEQIGFTRDQDEQMRDLLGWYSDELNKVHQLGLEDIDDPKQRMRLETELYEEKETLLRAESYNRVQNIYTPEQWLRLARINIQLKLNCPFPMGVYQNEDLMKYARGLSEREFQRMSDEAEQQQAKFLDDLQGLFKDFVAADDDISPSKRRQALRLVEPATYQPLAQFNKKTELAQLLLTENAASLAPERIEEFETNFQELVTKHDHQLREKQSHSVQEELAAVLGDPLTVNIVDPEKRTSTSTRQEERTDR